MILDGVTAMILRKGQRFQLLCRTYKEQSLAFREGAMASVFDIAAGNNGRRWTDSVRLAKFLICSNMSGLRFEWSLPTYNRPA